MCLTVMNMSPPVLISSYTELKHGWSPRAERLRLYYLEYPLEGGRVASLPEWLQFGWRRKREKKRVQKKEKEKMHND